MDLTAIMTALAGAVPSAAANQVYAHPVGSLAPPAVVVGYPTDVEFDVVFTNASHRLVFPVFYVCGMVDDGGAQVAVSNVFGGTNQIKTAIETNATLLTKVQTARVTDAAFQSVTIGAVDMIAVRFDVEVYT